MSTLHPITLSILVPTIPERGTKLARLLAILDPQIAAVPGVELLVLRDNRARTIGAKRNAMLTMAAGRYAAFVDDDDLPEPDYVTAIHETLIAAAAPIDPPMPDVVCFDVRVTGYGEPKICRYDPSYVNQDLPDGYRRRPNHLMVFRTALARMVPFPDIAYGEDTLWANQMHPLLQHTARIDRVLYTYAFDHADNAKTVRS